MRSCLKARHTKCILLAAGHGTRLGPLTEHTPKCLLPVRGEPLLAKWCRNLAAAGVREAKVNTHWLAEKVEQFVSTLHHKLGINIETQFERELLGSAGSVLALRQWWCDADEILVIYANNVTSQPLSELLLFHRAHSLPVTLGASHTLNTQSDGVVSVDDDDVVRHFSKKQSNPGSELATAGLYVFERDFLDELFPPSANETEVLDLGHDVLPKILGKMKVFRLQYPLLDIGTPEAYAKAQELEHAVSPRTKW